VIQNYRRRCKFVSSISENRILESSVRAFVKRETSILFRKLWRSLLNSILNGDLPKINRDIGNTIWMIFSFDACTHEGAIPFCTLLLDLRSCMW